MGRHAADGLTALMVSQQRLRQLRCPLSPRRAPLGRAVGDTQGSYSGDAAIPKRPGQEDPNVPPRRQAGFVMDLWAWVVRREQHPLRNGVGPSPVSVIDPCDQATPPTTPRGRDGNRNARLRRRSQGPPSASARFGAWHPHEAETRHLPIRPCPAPSPPPVAGRRWLLPPLGRWTRISGRVRPRPGRIKSPYGNRTVYDSVNNTCGSHKPPSGQ